MPGKHSRFFAPSSLHRRILCPGSARLEAGIPEQTSRYARWGTAAHNICEIYGSSFAENPGEFCQKFIGKTSEGETVTQEMAEACTLALTHLHELAKSMNAQPNECGFEIKVNANHWGIPDMFGTADVVIEQPFKQLAIMDYKFGQGVVVEPEENPALMAYALMVAGDLLQTYQEITLAISQPRVCRELKTWTMRPSQLAAWRDGVLLPLVEKINAGTDELHADMKACRFCKAKSVCPAYTAQAAEAAALDFAAVEKSTPAEQPTITPELVARVYPQLPLLEDWIARVKEEALNMAGAGTLPGYKLVEGRGRREWADEEEAEKAIRGQGKDPYEYKLLSPAKAEKLGKAVKEAITPFVNRIPGNPVIAPVDDKRPALSTAAQDFKEVAALSA